MMKTSLYQQFQSDLPPAMSINTFMRWRVTGNKSGTHVISPRPL